MIESIQTGRNWLTEEQWNRGPRDQVPALRPGSVQRNRQDWLNDHSAPNLRAAPVDLAVGKIEIHVSEEGPHIRNRVGQLLTGLRDVSLGGSRCLGRRCRS